ncbi:hypothetical protein LYNGBM3L_73120 [Moorena producens 3L]|uniref:Uncharacterized protein n=1 Tax=Moorena producens 3L TaxID=489825 RepID=F4Y350_9CYAN|nr:hypothetical protein LYNGBM3L_73120 [Moorena producens 3L]
MFWERKRPILVLPLASRGEFGIVGQAEIFGIT